MLLFISPSGNPIPIKNALSQFTGEAKYLFSSSLEKIFAHYFQLDRELSKDELIRLRESLFSEKIDAVQVNQLLQRSSKSLFAFDMDSTLIKEEVIDELARRNGVYEEVANVTKEAMEGKLDFDSALRKRCNYLKGIKDSAFDEIFRSITPNDGVVELLPWIQKYNGQIAIFSGGFVPVVEKFAKHFSISLYAANHLEIENGFTTGKVLGTIVNKNQKKELLIKYREENQVLISQTVAVGDGSNDSLMLNEAGIGIGFHAKSGLKKEILNWIDHHSMLSLLFLYDLRD